MKQNKTYLHLGVTLIVSACAVLMFYDTFFQSRVLLDFFDKLMQVLSPVIYGLAFAYLLAPIVDFFDRLIEKAAPKAKSSVIRGLSILITWLCVNTMIYLMFSILIPELVDSVKTLAANFETYYKTVYNWVTALMENENLFSTRCFPTRCSPRSTATMTSLSSGSRIPSFRRRRSPSSP